ncbi:MAG: hypothetical protein H6570_15095 [Lewinellaceae bacterium]|nr:hypothetical protein [Lewinellaceae bacterium]
MTRRNFLNTKVLLASPLLLIGTNFIRIPGIFSLSGEEYDLFQHHKENITTELSLTGRLTNDQIEQMLYPKRFISVSGNRRTYSFHFMNKLGQEVKFEFKKDKAISIFLA